MENIPDNAVHLGCLYSGSAHPDQRGLAHLNLSAHDETEEAFSPIGTVDLTAKSGRPTAGGWRWSGRRASQ
jgi:hypothetical protein